MNLEKWKQAIVALKEAVNLKPDYQGAHYNLGVAYLMSGDKKAATEEYQKLRTLNPNNAKLLYIMIYKKQPPTD